MTEKLKYVWVYGISAAFIAVNCYYLTKDQYWSLFLPVVVLLAILYIVRLDRVILLITFLTPLAVNIRNFEFGFAISIPSEPLMFCVLVLFLLKLIYDGRYDSKILMHPVSIAIMIQFLWMFITSITSEIPLVSFKYLLSRLWFVVPFYFVAILLFKDKKNIKLFQWLYVIPLIFVIAYTTYHHALKGFDEEAGHWVMDPFYNDHTAYGSIMAMFIPVFFGYTFNKEYKPLIRLISFGVFIILSIALYLSFSRAAWISLAGGVVFYLIILFKIRFRWVFLVTGVVLILFFIFQDRILDRLEENKQDSSANFIEHVQSIYNISSDASNLERINRWQSALRMFNERPFFGWGPGTYQFVYAPFQRSKEKTIISTNAGDMGNAHSEYIGPLSEMGVIGLLIVLFLVASIVYTGLRVYKNSEKREIKLISLITMVGLVTYFVHGLLNNFLDTDKASVPFWGFVAILVSLDLYYLNNKKNRELEKEKGD